MAMQKSTAGGVRSFKLLNGQFKASNTNSPPYPPRMKTCYGCALTQPHWASNRAHPLNLSRQTRGWRFNAQSVFLSTLKTRLPQARSMLVHFLKWTTVGLAEN